jgi:hypothetical protein
MPVIATALPAESFLRRFVGLSGIMDLPETVFRNFESEGVVPIAATKSFPESSGRD